MKPRAALFLTVAFVFIVFGNYFFFFSPERESRETVIIERAIDGDTVVLRDGRTIRLININTPEKKETDYEAAHAFLASFENTSVFLDARGTEKYGRTLGALYTQNLYINLEIVRRGLAHNFLVDDEEIKIFARAQEEAYQEERGVWKRSPDYGCMRAEINKKDEYVLITLDCASTLTGWSIKDETTHSYRLGSASESTVTLYSGEGMETPTSLYWGRGHVWNDDRDTLFVRDKDGLLVLYQPYGY